MKNFPELESHQVALLRADYNTGEILDAEFSLAVNNNQEIFTVFNSLEEATNYAKSIIKNNHNIECVIQGPDEDMLQYLTPLNFQSF